MLVLTI